MTKSVEWLRMTPEERFDHRVIVAHMLDRIGPELARFNPGAAEAAFRSAANIRTINELQIVVLLERERERNRREGRI